MEKRIFIIRGMHCAACAAAIERSVKKLPGVREAYVNIASSELSYTGSDNDSEILNAVAKAGFSGERLQKNLQEQLKSQPSDCNGKKEIAELIMAWLSGLLLILLAHFYHLPLYCTVILMVPVLYAGRKFFTGGLPALFRGRPDMNSLIATGVLSALIYSCAACFILPGSHLFFDAGAMILMLVMLGKFLESRSKRKAADALRALVALSPDEALEVLKDGSERRISAAEIRPGMIFKILPGCKVPADGRVISGNSSCNESMFTGEPLPAVKTAGSPVTGGSINNDGVLIMACEASCEDSMLSRIIETVREAQGTRAPVARIADKVAAFFVWGVLAIALTTFAVHIFSGSSIYAALNYALGVMMIACPCSLGLATPVALICGIGKGASCGILIKSGAVMEELSRIRVVLFDKTGTLTTGKFSISRIISLHEKWNEDKIIALAAGLEKNTTHPLGEAVVGKAAENFIETPEISEAVTIPGYGVKALFCGRTYEIGRDDEECAAEHGESSMVLKENGVPVGRILLHDTLREEAAETVKALQKMGFRVEMLTGDNNGAAAAVANRLGLDGFHASLLPVEKSCIVNELRSQYGAVAMIGDGINDAPALASANVGIAVGSGTAAAIEAADAVLISNNLKNVPAAFDLSRRTMNVVRQNLFWAFAYNIVGIPLAAGVFETFLPFAHISPVFCAAAMGASSITVVLNALRLKIQKFSAAVPNFR